MPVVRSRILPEVGLAGRAKTFLDVLVWMREPRLPDVQALDELETLRIYLNSIPEFQGQIRVWVPRRLNKTINALEKADIKFSVVDSRKPDETIRDQFKGADPEIADAVSTALGIDADCLATNHTAWFPFIEEVENVSILLTDCTFLLPYSELFVRGHDIPWAFGHQAWNMPWTVFYQMAEQRTFMPGLEVLHKAFQKGASADALETGRSLVYNRLANLCFTRDRLLFYEIQRLAAKRRGWKRQRFAFEIAYYLNFNYLLIYGTFDHAALFVSQLLKLGLNQRKVGATNKGFLGLLEKKSPSLYSTFTGGTHKPFIDRIGALRHFAAHRGSLIPTTVVEKLDHEPTVEALDTDIKASGNEYIINMLPKGKAREGFREMLRSNARSARYQKSTVLEDVVPIELDGKISFIRPHVDTDWNFARVMTFLNEIFAECSNLLD